jgi:hypothetical protein
MFGKEREPVLKKRMGFFVLEGVVMAKYTASIDEDTRQRIHALPRGINFSAFMRKAINVFVEELEKNHDLKPENFIITCTARKDASDKKRR